MINIELLHWQLDTETVIAHMIHTISGYTPSIREYHVDSMHYTLSSGGSRISLGGGTNPPEGHQHMILPNFPQNCMKLKEFGPPAVHPSCPLP